MSTKKENINLQEDKNQFSRRDFIKATGVTAGIAGVAAVGSATPALAGEKSTSAITNFAVKEVDRPPYMDFPFEYEDSKFERFSEFDQAFTHPELTKEFESGAYFIPQYYAGLKKIENDEPGFTLLDKALNDAAGVSNTLSLPWIHSWAPLGLTDPTLAEKLGKKYDNPTDNNRYIKKAAHLFGAGDCGVAAVNEKFFYSKVEGNAYQTWPFQCVEKEVIFTDKYDVPTITEEVKYIPKKMNRIIVLAIPLEGSITQYSSSFLGGSTAVLGYSKRFELTTKVAEFIRGLGYNAISMCGETFIHVAAAIDAGLGELGRNGLLINPKYGQLLKLCGVLTDMPIDTDKPINFGAAEFCRTCMKCAESCPSGAISTDKETSYEIKCPSNNPGMKKWYVNTWDCLKYWTELGNGCQNCVVACPYSKPQTWIHDVVKGVSSKTALFNSTFRLLDDVLGYGKMVEDNDPNEWWESEEHVTEWLDLK